MMPITLIGMRMRVTAALVLAARPMCGVFKPAAAVPWLAAAAAMIGHRASGPGLYCRCQCSATGRSAKGTVGAASGGAASGGVARRERRMRWWEARNGHGSNRRQGGGGGVPAAPRTEPGSRPRRPGSASRAPSPARAAVVADSDMQLAQHKRRGGQRWIVCRQAAPRRVCPWTSRPAALINCDTGQRGHRSSPGTRSWRLFATASGGRSTPTDATL